MPAAMVGPLRPVPAPVITVVSFDDLDLGAGGRLRRLCQRLLAIRQGDDPGGQQCRDESNCPHDSSSSIGVVSIDPHASRGVTCIVEQVAAEPPAPPMGERVR
jgi:hypothetical protein